ncbi:MAG: class II aldolase/adducin family protein [Treponema sp.]|jgi:rhamnose utilization protein RhaD (predicted bifunctional aldolase and dehydrogenase)|nr:class II aldolase/adducin family protein [Treponema sp.]
MSIEALVEISRYYGNNPEYILAGGGNSSWKDGDILYVKASGHSLAEAVPDSFVKMDRKALARILENNYSESEEKRENEVLSCLMAARKSGEEQNRPSVETILHDILPFTFVVHTHPALVNGLTCSQRGEYAMKEIFDKDAIWIPSTNPGYVLSKAVKAAMDSYISENNKPASIIFLQNHGVFVGADNVEAIKELYGEIFSKIGAMIKRRPDFSGETRGSGSVIAGERPASIARTLSGLAGGIAAFFCGGETSAMVAGCASFDPVSSAFTPDHIVYAGSDPLFVESGVEDEIIKAYKEHELKTGRKPKITAIMNLGVFSAAPTEKAANFALDLFKDAIKVAVYSESFGGPLFMTKDKINFINNWEVERYRSSVSTK